MKTLKESMRKRLANKHMGHQMIGALALNEVRRFFSRPHRVKSVQEVKSLDDKEERDEFLEYIDDQSGIDGYVRYKVLFVKTSDPHLKIQIFKQKSQILEAVNLALKKVGYSTIIEELRIKN